jgi:hypothetical protein
MLRDRLKIEGLSGSGARVAEEVCGECEGVLWSGTVIDYGTNVTGPLN